MSGEEFVVQDIPSYSRNNSTNEFNLIHDDEEFYNVEVLAADVPLQRTNSRRLNSTDETEAPSFSRNNSEDNLKDPIHKYVFIIFSNKLNNGVFVQDHKHGEFLLQERYSTIVHQV